VTYRHRTQLAAALVTVGLLAAACTSDADSASTAPSTASQPEQPTTSNDSAVAPVPTTASTSPDAEATTATPVAVPEALQFTAPLVGGGEFTGADYAGKPTVFWFWAPT
jgi:hypothetical protein